MWSIENMAHHEQADTTHSHSHSEEETPQSIEAALLSGKIPSVLSDQLRIVPLESKAGQLFQDEMEVIARRLHEHWDVTKNPIRFFLMDLPGVNACQVKGANPPLIGFTKGCFIPTESEGFKKVQFEPLTTIDEITLLNPFKQREGSKVRIRREHH
ncbi:MAG: hypothetical protein ACO3XO_06655 [Bdellovibrionota bacterium]|jgi:hypothetical protein